MGRSKSTPSAAQLNTVLGVYTGDAVDQLTLVAANDDALDTQSQLVFDAAAGQTYRIAVDGYEDAVGDIMVRLGVRPANDDFAGDCRGRRRDGDRKQPGEHL